MKFKITFVMADDTEDTLIISGDTIDELQALTLKEYIRRGAKDAWSEEVERI